MNIKTRIIMLLEKYDTTEFNQTFLDEYPAIGSL